MNPKSKILIIDDSQNECFLLSEYLSSETSAASFEVKTTNDLSEAREILASSSFDCIIVDHLMGVETGLEFIAEFKKTRSASTPIILISGYTAPQLQQEAINAGAAAFIAKSDITEEQLNHIVSDLIGCAA